MTNHEPTIELDSVLSKVAQIRLEGTADFADSVLEKIESDRELEESTSLNRLPVPVPEVERDLIEDCVRLNESDSSVETQLEKSRQPGQSQKRASVNARVLAVIVTALLCVLVSSAWFFGKDLRDSSALEFGASRPTQPSTVSADFEKSQGKSVAPEPRNKKPLELQLVYNDGPGNFNATSQVPNEIVAPSRDIVDDRLVQPIGMRPVARNNVAPDLPKRVMPEGASDWELALNFDSHGVAKAFVNGEELNNVVFHQNLEPVLKQVAVSAERRMAYVEPRLGQNLNGSLKVEDESFRFNDRASLHSAIDKAIVATQRLDFEKLSLSHAQRFQPQIGPTVTIGARSINAVDLLNQIVRSGSLSGSFPLPSNFQTGTQTLQQLTSGDFKFATPDEVDFVHSALKQTDRVLHQLAVDRYQWEAANQIAWAPNPDSVRSSQPAISNEDFIQFVNSGSLNIPEPRNISMQPMIQKLDEKYLKAALNDIAIPVNLFRTDDEYRKATQFISNRQRRAMEQTPAQRKKLSLLEQEEYRASQRLQKDRNDPDKFRAYREASSKRNDYFNMLRDQNREPGLQPLKKYLKGREDLEGLPLVMGDECHVKGDDAKSLDNVSKSVGRTLGMFDRFGSRAILNNNSARNSMVTQEIDKCCHMENRERGLSTLDQVLQVDHPRLRSQLISALQKSTSDDAMHRIANRAKYDLVSDVRVFATEALRDFPIEKVRSELVEGLEYPWSPVAMHSAEALVRLDDKKAVPQLIELLDKPNPHLPVRNETGKYEVRELVSINHMRNCMLCHAPSTQTFDYGRAVTPSIDRPIPNKYYRPQQSPGDSFVRADVTYLQQDFSVQQEVKHPGHWPRNQRFDYVVRKRTVPATEAARITQAVASAKTNEHRAAVVFALESLTGKKTRTNSKDEWIHATGE